jgi:hypothetical protein
MSPVSHDAPSKRLWETVGGKNHQRFAGTFAALQRDDEAAEGASRD